MPAVSVEDPLSLPRLPAETATARMRPVVSVTTAPHGLEGEGFPVRRAFAGVPMDRLDPFVHLDQMGEVDYAPGEAKGTAWHPHRGFETVTYLIDGTFEHHDSTGGGGRISNGDTQWMTAGAGILHIEAPPEELVVAGGVFHGLQLWVNLPAADKWVPPSYQDITAGRVGLVASHDGGAVVRIVAGEVAGHAGPGRTHTPITMVHATINPGARLALPWAAEQNALVYALAGGGQIVDGTSAAPLETGQLAVLGTGDSLAVTADDDSAHRPLELLLLGGRPIKEPVAWSGPFVMNTKAELAQAYDDFRAGKLGRIPTSAGHPSTTDTRMVEQ